MSNYSIEFYPGEEDRLPEWNVVRWNVINSFGKIGSKVFTSYDMVTGEEECKEYLDYLVDMESGVLA